MNFNLSGELKHVQSCVLEVGFIMGIGMVVAILILWLCGVWGGDPGGLDRRDSGRGVQPAESDLRLGEGEKGNRP